MTIHKVEFEKPTTGVESIIHDIFATTKTIVLYTDYFGESLDDTVRKDVKLTESDAFVLIDCIGK